MFEKKLKIFFFLRERRGGGAVAAAVAAAAARPHPPISPVGLLRKERKKKLYLNPSGFDHCKSNMTFLLIRVKIVKCTSREMHCYNFQISASRNSSSLFLGLLEKTK